MLAPSRLTSGILFRAWHATKETERLEHPVCTRLTSGGGGGKPWWSEILPDQRRLEAELTPPSNTRVADGGVVCHQQNACGALPKEPAVAKG